MMNNALHHTAMVGLAACVLAVVSACDRAMPPRENNVASAPGADGGAALLSMPTSTPEAVITVRTDDRTGSVKTAIFGNNLEAGDTKGVFGDVSVAALMQSGGGVWDPVKREVKAGPMRLAREIGMTGLRYPGGCLAHNFDWKKTVGPPDQRKNWSFGVDEFLTVCRAWGTEPIIIIADYFGSPQDAADLVEYLNAPATEENPWAMKRAENGHLEPYGVTWFELGNETDHGNHAGKIYSAEEYAAFAKSTAEAMRAVDPTVRLGIVTAAGKPVDDPWNPVVFREAGGVADFVVVHLYPVNYSSNEPDAPEDKLMQACMAAGEQLERMIFNYRESIRNHAGRELPIAMTEYNGGFVQEKPKRYRFSYGAALFSADFVRILLKPDSGVEMANYWQFINGYWGMVHGSGEDFEEMPAFTLFRLWGQHFGSEMVGVEVETPRIDFEGSHAVAAASGEVYVPAKPAEETNLFAIDRLSPSDESGVRIDTDEAGSMVVELTDVSGARYPTLVSMDRPEHLGDAGIDYLLSFDARFVIRDGTGLVGLGLADPRGWEKTGSAVALAITPTEEWKKFGGKLEAQRDAPGVNFLLRVEPSAVHLTGRIEIRNIQLSAAKKEEFPGYEALTATASLSPEGDTLYLMVFNKHTGKDLDTQVSLEGFTAMSPARRWTVNGARGKARGIGPGINFRCGERH